MSVFRQTLRLLLALGLGVGVSLAQDVATSPIVRRSLVGNLDATAARTKELAAAGFLLFQVGVVFVEVPPALAARWGLDGWPAPDPARTPLGREMGSRLSAADAVRFRQALTAENCSILASISCVTLSGNPRIVRNVSERRVEAGEDTEGVGVTLEATPTLAADGTRVDLEYNGDLGRVELPGAALAVRTTGRLPIRVIWVKGKATLACGQTALIRCGVPPPATTRAPAADANVIIVLLRLDRVLVPGAPPNVRKPTE